MKVTPKTEEQVKEEQSKFGLLEKGEYPADIYDAFDKVSKANNEMLHLKLKVYDSHGRMWLIDDYLLDAMAYKLRHCCDATGNTEKYESGEIMASDFKDKSVTVKVGIQKSKDPKYPDRNTIIDYVVDDKKQKSELNDEIPW